jgi:hypothetical protein
MVETRNRSNKKSVKSKELRKYEVAYNKCIKMCLRSKRCKKSVKKAVNDVVHLDKSRKRRKSALKKSRNRRTSKSKSKKRLNPYQKFVKRESAKSIYRGKGVKSRMRAIAKLWKKSKN